MASKSATTPFTQGMATDANRDEVLSFGSFVTSDATASPQTSPLTVSSTPINLVVPDNAVQLVVSNNANALRISELANVSTYFTLPASTMSFVIDCAKMTNIYLLRDSGDVTVQFFFQII